MDKTDRQVILELQHGKTIEAVLRDTLAKFRGRKSYVALSAIDLGLSDATLYGWCEELGIDIKEYRGPTDEILTSTPRES